MKTAKVTLFKPCHKNIDSIMKYAKLISQRGLVCNTFGNISIQSYCQITRQKVIYTKHRGVSLEEMNDSNVIVVGTIKGELLYGDTLPSIGHQMHREIFKYRSDVNAVIHLHPNQVISYFSIYSKEKMPFISNDAALVFGAPVKILPTDLNIEADLTAIRSIVRDTNCIVMPQHGITTLGSTLSEAYHRACSLIAEVDRIIGAKILASFDQREIPFIAEEEVDYMNKIGKYFIYG